ncbi:MAG TPA: class I SAM-dependent methyltransferase [Bacteroidales bacterium]|nr:class I SAM-dependent methyltransferase [Bacteroidales bacterium]
MKIKPFLLKIYYWPYLSKEKYDFNQKKIRETEWDAISGFMRKNIKFLDVGCGTGYVMEKIKNEFAGDCFGIDPEPLTHGVDKFQDHTQKKLNIVRGIAEQIPFPDGSFDVVYSSHVLEHVDDEPKSLMEIKRVLKDDGMLIIGMPTAAMAWVSFITNLLFTSHIRFFNVISKPFPFIHKGETKMIHMFIPGSHSPNKADTVFFDMRFYRISRWKKAIENYFQIQKTLLPAFYPYPEFRQLFKMRKYKSISSSVFFICKKK